MKQSDRWIRQHDRSPSRSVHGGMKRKAEEELVPVSVEILKIEQDFHSGSLELFKQFVERYKDDGDALTQLWKWTPFTLSAKIGYLLNDYLTPTLIKTLVDTWNVDRVALLIKTSGQDYPAVANALLTNSTFLRKYSNEYGKRTVLHLRYNIMRLPIESMRKVITELSVDPKVLIALEQSFERENCIKLVKLVGSEYDYFKTLVHNASFAGLIGTWKAVGKVIPIKSFGKDDIQEFDSFLIGKVPEAQYWRDWTTYLNVLKDQHSVPLQHLTHLLFNVLFRTGDRILHDQETRELLETLDDLFKINSRLASEPELALQHLEGTYSLSTSVLLALHRVKGIRNLPVGTGELLTKALTMSSPLTLMSEWGAILLKLRNLGVDIPLTHINRLPKEHRNKFLPCRNIRTYAGNKTADISFDNLSITTNEYCYDTEELAEYFDKVGAIVDVGPNGQKLFDDVKDLEGLMKDSARIRRRVILDTMENLSTSNTPRPEAIVQRDPGIVWRNVERELLDITQSVLLKDNDEELALQLGLVLMAFPQSWHSIGNSILELLLHVAPHILYRREFIHSEAWQELLLPHIQLKKPENNLNLLQIILSRYAIETTEDNFDKVKKAVDTGLGFTLTTKVENIPAQAFRACYFNKQATERFIDYLWNKYDAVEAALQMTKDFDEDAVNALYLYSITSSYFNKPALYKNRRPTETQLQAIDKLSTLSRETSVRTTKPIVVWRGIRVSSINDVEVMASSFMSVSLSHQVSTQFVGFNCCLLRITLTKGIPLLGVDPVSFYKSGELEILLPAGVSLRIEGKKFLPDRTIIYDATASYTIDSHLSTRLRPRKLSLTVDDVAQEMHRFYHVFEQYKYLEPEDPQIMEAARHLYTTLQTVYHTNDPKFYENIFRQLVEPHVPPETKIIVPALDKVKRHTVKPQWWK